MIRILHIESSARSGAVSYSRRFAAALVERLAAAAGPGGADVTVRDLAAAPLPHVDDAFVAATFVPADERTPAQRRVLAESERLIDELDAADVVVIGAPMYNYSIPSTLKAWIDHVVRARRTFRHTPDGPVGLLRDRPVYVVTASGGVYADGPGTAVDFLSPYVRAVLGKIGLSSIEFLRIEGLAAGDDAARAGVARAYAALDRIAPAPAAAAVAAVA
jgi:FMN-dependent NADH-azoreductase